MKQKIAGNMHLKPVLTVRKLVLNDIEQGVNYIAREVIGREQVLNDILQEVKHRELVLNNILRGVNYIAQEVIDRGLVLDCFCRGVACFVGVVIGFGWGFDGMYGATNCMYCRDFKHAEMLLNAKPSRF